MDQWTVKELQQEARNLGITGFWGLRKQELYKLVVKGKKKPSPPPKKPPKKLSPAYVASLISSSYEDESPTTSTRVRLVQGHCTKGKVVNPISGRCIGVGGEVYKKVLKTMGHFPYKLPDLSHSRHDAPSPVVPRPVAPPRHPTHYAPPLPPAPRSSYEELPPINKDDIYINIKDVEKLKKQLTGTTKNKCFDLSNYTIEKEKLGEGTFGSVHDTAGADGQYKYVAKINKKSDENQAVLFGWEAYLTEKLGRLGISPKVEFIFKCKIGNTTRQAMILEKLDGSLWQFPDLTDADRHQLLNLIYRFHKAGFIHKDLYDRNILFKKNKDGTRRFYISDLGMGILFDEDPFPWKLAYYDLYDFFTSIKSLKFLHDNIPKEYIIDKTFKSKEEKEYRAVGMVVKLMPNKMLKILGEPNVQEWNHLSDEEYDAIIEKRFKSL